MKSLVSVLMPVHNGTPYLDDAVRGILDQTYKNFELIIVDDASSDGSLSLLEHYAKKDSRIRIIKNEKNVGLTKSLIRAAESADGEYLARQDADDVSLPERLEKQVDFLEHHPSYGAIGTLAAIIDGDNNVIKNANVPTSWFVTRQVMKFGNCFLHGSMMFRKEDYLKAGGYRRCFYFGQDFDLWLRISKSRKMKNLNRRLYRWRARGDNISATRTDPQFKIGALALYEHRYNRRLDLDDDFEIDTYIKNLNREERKKYDACLRNLCLRHGNTEMAKTYLDGNFLNRILIKLTEIMFSIKRAGRR